MKRLHFGAAATGDTDLATGLDDHRAKFCCDCSKNRHATRRFRRVASNSAVG